SETAGEADGGNYVVIAGSFVSLKKAEAQAQELREDGYDPFITQVPIGDQMYSRVNVATYSTREKAEALTEILRRKGYEVRVGVH
ncbi:MAG: SPOR domain-containing protein, partial [Armatimonadota bacterium]